MFSKKVSRRVDEIKHLKRRAKVRILVNNGERTLMIWILLVNKKEKEKEKVLDIIKLIMVLN
jgi:hypothetical protein